ncbi:MAG: sulfotransferase [Candidatus Heimdallarchaeota archaeon]
MRNRKKSLEIREFSFPLSMYYIARYFYNHHKFNMKLNRWESKKLQKRTANILIDRPIYITGLTRAGTTIILEMFSKHFDTANHRYLHMVNPYIPNIIQKIANKTRIFVKKSERLHKDRIVVNRSSPEAVEEIFWQRFFSGIIDEKVSNVYTSSTVNEEFEEFYEEHMKKLLCNQNSSRYLVKNNYNVSRMDYILKLFPTAKFLIVVRNPINHIASIIKQDQIFHEMEKKHKQLLNWTKIIGHREFGSAKFCINVNNTEEIERIRELWKDEETCVKGWAIYWSSIYEAVLGFLQKNKELEKAILIVRYEDLCDNSNETLDNIINHLELSHEKFAEIKAEYSTKLTKPTYYEPQFTKKEIQTIIEHTKKTAEKFSYKF